MERPASSRPFKLISAAATVVVALAVGWSIEPDSMRADAPRLREVRTSLLSEPGLGRLVGPDGRSIQVLPGDPNPRYRLLDAEGHHVATVEDPAALEADHAVGDPSRLLADVPTWSDED